MPAPRNETSSMTLRDASSSMCRVSSASERAGGTSSARWNRTPAGMSRKSSSTESTPIAASISRRSASVSERKLTDAPRSAAAEPPHLQGQDGSPRDFVLVGGDVHQRVALGRVAHADADEPALAVRVLVHRLRRVDDGL